MRLVHVFSALLAVCAGTSMLSSMVSQPLGAANRTLLSGNSNTSDTREFLERRSGDDNSPKRCGSTREVARYYSSALLFDHKLVQSDGKCGR
ncbi:hypothetical protein AYI70_g7736 [Smittium culicis]|uniref:RxLR effector protein n=1 Tax=Smittium culicis TaxID=133412 RepID=A0A1R1XJ69_9FUNG|nr:hypothetical protein AYI70_g11501 [Smittium culicis]OMJ14679.1 hypothetical protein AYI70_g7736 [Smittium culicis]